MLKMANELKTTIVSLYPGIIHETKPGLIPSVAIITPPKIRGGYSVTLIADAYYDILVPGKEDKDPGRRIRMPVSSADFAESIINDFCNSHIGANDSAKPGLFAIKFQTVTHAEVAVKFKAELEIAKSQQMAWYKNLVALADDTWAKTGQHRYIIDMQRNAATELGLVKPWMNIIPDASQLCPACKSEVHPEAVICSKCHAVIKPEEYKKLEFAKA
jgi:hypothetical protein